MFNDASQLVRRMKTGCWTPVRNSPGSHSLGHSIIERTEKRLVYRQERQCGVRFFGLTAGDAWTAPTRQFLGSKRLSISIVELLPTATSFVLLGNYGCIQDVRRIVLRCDETSACGVSNTEVAFSTAIRFALRALTRT